MSRSPLSYPLNRGADLDGGGVADLQTDVMRFMAILSLCLVAIFALVQSIPAVPPPISETVQPATPPAPATQTTVPPPVKLPEPVAAPPPAPARKVSHEPVPVAVEMPRLAPAPPRQPTPAEEGFTLRFASDDALKALVVRNEIGLYAIAGGKAMRLDSDRGRLGFWQASVPNRVHEMDAATVPEDVIRALQRAGAGSDVYWGVTLTAKLARQLDRYLGEGGGGELVIAADGNLRRE